MANISTPRRQASSLPSTKLRAALGIRSPGGWFDVGGCRIAWEAIPRDAEESAQAKLPPAVPGQSGLAGLEERSRGRASQPRPEQLSQTILCLHAGGSGSREFNPLVNRRPHGSRLILLDWPGHGRSGDLEAGADGELTVDSAASILQVLLREPTLQDLKITRPILLGSGFGAAAALRFAAEFPDQAGGLVLCQPAGLIPSAAPRPTSLSKRGMVKVLRRIEKYSPDKTGSGVARTAKRQALRMQAVRPFLRSAVAACNKSVERSGESLRAALESLTVPALFALSHDSLEYPLSRYIALLEPSMAWAPRHPFTVFEGAFNPVWDEPERFAKMLASFVQARLPLEQHTHAWLLASVDWPTKDNNLWKCVHAECDAERVLPTGHNANEL